MDKLIDAVRAHPCLWNPNCVDYRDSHVKEDAWDIVVNQIQLPSVPTISAAKAEWRRLRDNHRDALKRAKLGKNKLLPAQITTWKYAKAMQFLEPHMKYRITENIELEQSNSPQANHDDVSTTETSVNEPQGTNSGLTAKKRKFEGPELKSTKKTMPSKTDPDPLESFYNCILQSTRAMPPHMQTQVKKKIFAVMIEAEEMLNNTQNSESVREQNTHPQPETNQYRIEDEYADYSEIVIKPEILTDSD